MGGTTPIKVAHSSCGGTAAAAEALSKQHTAVVEQQKHYQSSTRLWCTAGAQIAMHTKGRAPRPGVIAAAERDDHHEIPQRNRARFSHRRKACTKRLDPFLPRRLLVDGPYAQAGALGDRVEPFREVFL